MIMTSTTQDLITKIRRQLSVIQSDADQDVVYPEDITDLRDWFGQLITPGSEGKNETERMAAQADHAARTMAPPVPGITVNAGYTVRDVIYANPAGGGLLESWWVAAEDPERGEWVTWVAYAQDGSHAGQLAYTWGHYDGLTSHAAALQDLAIRAGIVTTAS
jgi:hypothetical protein